MALRQIPPADYLRERLDYDPETGIMTWKRRPREDFSTYQTWRVWNGKYSGKVAGRISRHGYSEVGINDKRHMAHRLIWVIQTGSPPEADIDHINCNRADNRWANLRAATRQQNMWNKVRLDGDLPTGVQRSKERFAAYIRVNGKAIYLGSFATPEEAHEAWRARASEAHGEFFRDPDKSSS